MPFRYEPAFGKEFLGLLPMAWVVMCAVVIAPYEAVFRWEALAVVAEEKEPGEAIPERGDG